jgi:hypothetical protein
MRWRTQIWSRIGLLFGISKSATTISLILVPSVLEGNSLIASCIVMRYGTTSTAHCTHRLSLVAQETKSLLPNNCSRLYPVIRWSLTARRLAGALVSSLCCTTVSTATNAHHGLVLPDTGRAFISAASFSIFLIRTSIFFIFFLLVSYLLANNIKLRLLWQECTLCHIGHAWRSIR